MNLILAGANIVWMRGRYGSSARVLAWWFAGLAAAGVAFAGASAAPLPERMILTGAPALGPTWLPGDDGAPVPAGCGPEAARILLAYYDRRYGYRFVGDDLDAAIRELHRRMGTITVVWEGVRQGLTWPWAFASGLRAYAEARCPGGVRVETAGGSLAATFDRAVALLTRGIPHVILFDWRGAGGILPNHYAVVVGYDRSGGRRHLILNPGWGYDFQLLDLADPAVAPVTLYWIEEILDPPDDVPGAPVGPPSAAGMWERGEDATVQLRPVLRLHSDPASTVRWPASSRVQPLVPGADDLTTAIWDGP